MYKYLRAKTANLRFKILHSKQFGYRIIKPLYKLLRFSLLFCVSQTYRYDRISQLKYKKFILQPHSTTKFNRYPDLFTICQTYFSGALPGVKLLSFGCSTGEEVATLHKYLPEATIVGLDINQHNLRMARRLIRHPQIAFMHYLSAAYTNSANYDAIFCLAVLQHTQNRELKNMVATKFTFAQFEQQLIQLDAKLKINGLLFIDQCDFNFMDLKIAERYKVLEVGGNRIVRERPLYDAHDQRVADESNVVRVFVKVG